MTKKHNAVRLDWAMKHMHWKTEWTKTIFSEEIKFNLIGPDGYRYYWHDLRRNNTSQNTFLVVELLWSGLLLDGTDLLIFLS